MDAAQIPTPSSSFPACAGGRAPRRRCAPMSLQLGPCPCLRDPPSSARSSRTLRGERRPLASGSRAGASSRVTGGHGDPLLAMNGVRGRFSDVAARGGPPSSQRRKEPLGTIPSSSSTRSSTTSAPPDQRPFRQPGFWSARWSKRLNPKLAPDTGTMADLAWSNMVKEVLHERRDRHGPDLDPAPELSAGSAVPPKEMTRHPATRSTGSPPRGGCFAHGSYHAPARTGRPLLHGPDRKAARAQGRRVEGLHGCPARAPTGGWRRGRREVAGTACPERARRKVASSACVCTRACRSAPWPTSTICAQHDQGGRDFPGPRLRSPIMPGSSPFPRRAIYRCAGGVTQSFAEMVKRGRARNIYMELGSTFGQLVFTTTPTACAHLTGQIVDAFGADHVLWGMDLDLVRVARVADRGIPVVRDPQALDRQVRLP